MMSDRLTSILARCLPAAAAVCALVSGVTGAEASPIDVQHSKLTVFAYKAGLLSAFGDDHVISAPIRSGSISPAPSPTIDFVVHATDLVVLDPDLEPERREEVRARMLGADVLDAARFATIRFESTAIGPAGPDRWKVSGNLRIRGVTRPITFTAVLSNDRYRGEVRIRQRDFGIEPIRVAGGTIRVKDELKVEFEIAAVGQR